MTKPSKLEKPLAHGHQPGERVNFLAVGSSSMSTGRITISRILIFPLAKCVAGRIRHLRGMKLSDDDKIRQHATQQIRSYFCLDLKTSIRIMALISRPIFQTK